MAVHLGLATNASIRMFNKIKCCPLCFMAVAIDGLKPQQGFGIVF